MKTMNPAVRIPEPDLAAFCSRWGVAEVELFGSALTPAFGPDSDIDLLVSPRPGTVWSLFEEVRMRDELAELFGRPVDLLVRSAIERSSNWIRRAEILGSATQIYAAR